MRWFRDFFRLMTIVSVFFEAGFSVWIKQMGISWCVGWRCRLRCWWQKKHCHQQNLPQKLRLSLEKLGPLFMKLGQILSMRPDSLPAEYVAELKLLQDKAQSFPYMDVRKILQEELRGTVEKNFRSFDAKPIASASLGQVHIAILKTGEKVAVKVQRPHIRKIIDQDIRILFFLIRRLERYFPDVARYRPQKMLETFVESLQNELDYEIEGRNADRFASNFRREKGIKIPAIFWSHTRKRVLTMEFIDGIRMGELALMKHMKIDHHTLMKNCTRGCLLPIFSYGFFHADPHPGNVWVLPGNRVCYLDFGMVGVISDELRLKILMHFLLLSQENIEGALFFLRLMLERDKGFREEAFVEEARSMMISFFKNREDDTTITSIFYDLVSKAVNYRLYFPPELVMLAKALLTGETMCRMTHPKFDLLKSSRPTLEGILRDEFTWEKLVTRLPEIARIAEKFIKDFLKISPRAKKG